MSRPETTVRDKGEDHRQHLRTKTTLEMSRPANILRRPKRREEET